LASTGWSDWRGQQEAGLSAGRRTVRPVDAPTVVAPLSESFRATALAEREELVRLYQQARERHERLVGEAEQVALEADRYLRAARELGELLGIEDQLSIANLTEELRGERLRHVAAEIVFRTFKPHQQFHYKEWLEHVVAAGYRIGGKNPTATFLTQAAQVEGVVRVGRRTGIYRLEPIAACGEQVA
jgi:hypothetical protein